MWDGEERRTHQCQHVDKIDEMKDKIDDIHIILTGNSTPEKGVCFKVAENTRFINAIRKWVWVIVVLLTTATVTNIGNMAGIF